MKKTVLAVAAAFVLGGVCVPLVWFALGRSERAGAVTPPGRPRRFNARFFMARAEDAMGEIRHSSELGDIRWVRLDEARELPLPTITGLILGEVGRLMKEPPDRSQQRKIPLFTTVHRRHLMLEE